MPKYTYPKVKKYTNRKKVPRVVKKYVKSAIKRMAEPKYYRTDIIYGNAVNVWTSNQFRELSLCTPTKGTDATNRIGDQVKITGLHLKLSFDQVFDDSSDIWYGFRRPTETFRIFIIEHKSSNQAILDVEDVLVTNTANYSNIIAPRNTDYNKTMTILYDKVHTITNDNDVYPELGSGSYASTKKVITIKKMFRTPITQYFDGNTGTYQDVVKNRLLFGIIWYGALQTNIKPYLMTLASTVQFYDS